MKIADLPLDDRPREKAFALGIGALTDAELLALILGKGSPGHSALETAFSMISRFGDLSGLSEATLAQLCVYPGVKAVKGISLLAVFELAKRIHTVRGASLPYRPDELAKSLSAVGEHESLFLIAMDGRGKMKTRQRLDQGGEDFLSLHPKDVLSSMIQSKYRRFVLVHHHPSGQALPSKEDIAFTSKLREEALSLNLLLFDHLIIAEDGYYSFGENGLL